MTSSTLEEEAYSRLGKSSIRGDATEERELKEVREVTTRLKMKRGAHM